MRNTRIVLMLAILGTAGVCCDARTSDQWQVRDWVQAKRSRNYYEQQEMRGQRQPISYRGGRDPYSPTDAYDGLSEMRQLLRGSPPDDSEMEAGSVLAKSILALPLLKRGNIPALVVRSQQDILISVLKRLVLARLGSEARVQAPEGMMAIDTHVHTCHSSDSLADVSEVLVAAARRGLGGVAITDHNTLEGASEAMAVLPTLVRDGKVPQAFLVIPGEEISSSDGHIVGLFLTTQIPPGRSAEWTVQEIRSQGGVAIAAHPSLPNSLGHLANELEFDAVETQNGAEKLHFALASGEARKRRAQFYGAVTLPHIAGSDAHDPQAVGQCYTLVKCSATAESARAAMLAGDVSPVAVAYDAEGAMVGRGLPRLVARALSAADFSPWVRRLTGTGNFNIGLMPRPVLIYTAKF